jgi:hypothetical protein
MGQQEYGGSLRSPQQQLTSLVASAPIAPTTASRPNPYAPSNAYAPNAGYTTSTSPGPAGALSPTFQGSHIKPAKPYVPGSTSGQGYTHSRNSSGSNQSMSPNFRPQNQSPFTPPSSAKWTPPNPYASLTQPNNYDPRSAYDPRAVVKHTAPPASSTYGDLPAELSDSQYRKQTPVSPLSPHMAQVAPQPQSLNMRAAAAPVDNEALLRRQFPLFSWGNGRTVAYVIPPSIAFGSASRTEIKVSNVSRVLSDDLLAKFPGVLVSNKGANKSKKKELEKWLEEKVGRLESQFESSRNVSADRLLLWKLLRILLKSESHLSRASPEIWQSIKELLNPRLVLVKKDDMAHFSSASDIYRSSLHQRRSSIDHHLGASKFGSEELREIFTSIENGARETALRTALDKKLWGHALVIASSLGPSQWNDAVAEFVREDVRTHSSPNAQSLSLIYRVLAGAGAESLSELKPRLPISANLRSTGSGTSDLANTLANWQTYLSLIVANRSPKDSEAVLELGKMLLQNGLTDAAHIW